MEAKLKTGCFLLYCTVHEICDLGVLDDPPSILYHCVISRWRSPTQSDREQYLLNMWITNHHVSHVHDIWSRPQWSYVGPNSPNSTVLPISHQIEFEWPVLPVLPYTGLQGHAFKVFPHPERKQPFSRSFEINENQQQLIWGKNIYDVGASRLKKTNNEIMQRSLWFATNWYFCKW